MTAISSGRASPAEEKVLRAITAREHRRAVHERREAQAAHADATAPAPTSTSWSTEPRPRVRRGKRSAKPSATPAAQARKGWAKRHPEAAASERSLRKDRAELLERYKRSPGTPETHGHAARHNQGALVRLYKNGVLDAEQLAAAVEIAEVVERIGRDVTVKTASLETRIDMTRMGDGSFYENLGHVWREMAYTRWRGEVAGPIAAVLDMIVGDPVGFTVVARRYRMHNRKAKQLLLDALTLWPRIFAGVRKDVDQATLLAAHAGILS
jgi:hypothetical protein